LNDADTLFRDDEAGSSFYADGNINPASPYHTYTRLWTETGLTTEPTVDTSINENLL
jgi:hypothetical protein